MKVTIAVVFLLSLSCLYCCTKDKANIITQSQPWSRTFSVGYQSDTVFYVNDTLYKVSFNSGVQEGRCVDITGNACSGLCGHCNVNVSITNLYTNQVIPLQEEIAGCELQADSLNFFSDNLSQGHIGFNFQIGLTAITPYPTNYNSIDVHKYRCIFLMKNT